MKKLLSLLLLISIGVVAHATKGDIFAVGNLNYQVISEPTSFSWGYVGVNSLTDAAKATSRLQIIVPRTVANGGVTYRVKNIQSRAFEASDIQSVDIGIGAAHFELVANDLGILPFAQLGAYSKFGHNHQREFFCWLLSTYSPVLCASRCPQYWRRCFRRGSSNKTQCLCTAYLRNFGKQLHRCMERSGGGKVHPEQSRL